MSATGSKSFEDGPQYPYPGPTARCEVCGKEILHPGRGSPARTCSPACRLERNRRKFDQINGEAYGLPTATVGAVHKLLAAVDLMRRGYVVFQAIAPSSACDLAILTSFTGREMLRVQVKSGYRTSGGTLAYPVGKQERSLRRFEILAVVERSGRITYFDSCEKEITLPDRVSAATPSPVFFTPHDPTSEP